jgi:ribosome-associated toxin RatA of RatAB toxin-antitoxin module
MTGSTTNSETQHTTHTVLIGAPAKVVYDIVADVTRWPYTFGPTVHAQVLETDGATERLRLWAFANGDVRSWTSRRALDPEKLTVHFEQEASAAPVVHMAGEWRIEPVGETTTRVEMLHDFRTATDDTVDLVLRAIEHNSTAELLALKQAAELGDDYEQLVLSFADSVTISAPKEQVYDFLYRADLWPRRLPHVARLELHEAITGVQSMEMDTLGPDGSVHTTHSVRVCLPYESIVYKQTGTPEIMAAHVGRWVLRPVGDAVEVTSYHTVVIRPDKVTEVIGPDATLGQAREMIRKALGANSLTTLGHAKTATEAASVEG